MKNRVLTSGRQACSIAKQLSLKGLKEWNGAQVAFQCDLEPVAVFFLRATCCGLHLGVGNSFRAMVEPIGGIGLYRVVSGYLSGIALEVACNL